MENKVIYNTKTGAIKQIETEAILPENWVFLTVIEEPKPTVSSNQSITYKWVVNAQNKTYTKTHSIRNKTAEELWEYPNYKTKMWVHGSVLFTPMGTAYRSFLNDKNYPVKMLKDGNYNVFLDDIEPAHQAYIDQLEQNGLLAITTRPF